MQGKNPPFQCSTALLKLAFRLRVDVLQDFYTKKKILYRLFSHFFSTFGWDIDQNVYKKMYSDKR